MQKKENWKYDRMKNSFKKKEERMRKRYQGGKKISSLLERDWAGDAEKRQQQLFLCYPPEKSVDNMLQRKNILLTAP